MLDELIGHEKGAPSFDDAGGALHISESNDASKDRDKLEWHLRMARLLAARDRSPAADVLGYLLQMAQDVIDRMPWVLFLQTVSSLQTRVERIGTK